MESSSKSSGFCGKKYIYLPIYVPIYNNCFARGKHDPVYKSINQTPVISFSIFE